MNTPPPGWSTGTLRAAEAAQLCPSLDRPVPELRGRRRLARPRGGEAEVLGTALRGDRPAGAGRRPALRHDGGAGRESRRPPADPRRDLPAEDRRRVAPPPRPPGDPELE